MTKTINELAQKHDFSPQAVAHLASAMQRGNGTQAQFNHPEFGGMGQWQNGMLMIGDAFNYALKAKISALCEDLSGMVGTTQSDGFKPMTMTAQHWWSDDLGSPSSSGQQNDASYAIFPDKARLAIKRNQQVTVYNTGTHRLTGVAQQQSNNTQHIVFTTNAGKTVSIADFEQVN